MAPMLTLDHFLNRRLALPIILAGCLSIAGLAILKPRRRTKAPLPPGPPGLPVVGNVFDVPTEEFWTKYQEWSEEYGSDVIHLNMVGTPVIILNSLKSVRDLLDTRSAIYSSRPIMPMLNDLIGFDWHFAFMEYGNKWRERRTIFQQLFHPSKMHLYRPASLTVVRTLLKQLLDDPEHFLEHGRRLSGAFILAVTYGIEVKSDDDIYIQQAERGMHSMALAGTASAFLVDFLPSLRHIPWWFPGASFKRKARIWKKDVDGMADKPLQYVKDALASGVATPCAATELLNELDAHTPEKEETIRGVLAAVYAAGSDTTVSVFGTFILAMMQHPEIQKKAQAAIDETISIADGLPDYSAFGTIPYVDALIRELFRWRPVTPIAVPHTVIQDDFYNGFHIPAGSTIIPNCWAILHNEEIYGPNASTFDPSRFLDPTQTAINPDMPMGHESFGFGRRLCPGFHVAVETVWIFVVSILSVYDILPSKDPQEAEAAGEYSSGLIIHPKPFKCQFVPRSDVAAQAIRAGL